MDATWYETQCGKALSIIKTDRVSMCIQELPELVQQSASSLQPSACPDDTRKTMERIYAAFRHQSGRPQEKRARDNTVCARSQSCGVPNKRRPRASEDGGISFVSCPVGRDSLLYCLCFMEDYSISMSSAVAKRMEDKRSSLVSAITQDRDFSDLHGLKPRSAALRRFLECTNGTTDVDESLAQSVLLDFAAKQMHTSLVVILCGEARGLSDFRVYGEEQEKPNGCCICMVKDIISADSESGIRRYKITHVDSVVLLEQRVVAGMYARCLIKDLAKFDDLARLDEDVLRCWAQALCRSMPLLDDVSCADMLGKAIGQYEGLKKSKSLKKIEERLQLLRSSISSALDSWKTFLCTSEKNNTCI